MLGEGAMARVFLALDESLDRKVAMKVMNRSLAHDPSFRDRFIAEAKDTAKFDHPGIVTIHGTGVVDDNYYLVLEFLDSGTLKDRIRERLQRFEELGEKPDQLFPVQEALGLLAEMADALDYAHKKKVVHRDLKPANILFRTDGAAVLSDFGIAKSVTENRELTMTGYSVGTPAYMSPEQKLGAADIDGRSDIYSLGIVFYELLTGRKPFQSQSGNFAELRKEMEADTPQLPEAASHLQPMLDRMLAKDPGDRYQTAADLMTDARQFMGVLGPVSEDATVLQQAVSVQSAASGARPAGRKKLVLVAVAVLAAAIIGIGSWQMMPEAPPEVIPVDAETAAEISTLLKNADMFYNYNRLIVPPVANGNAADLYHRILELQPNNPDALAGLDRVLQEVLVQVPAEVEAMLANDEQEQAAALVEAALHYFPDSEELTDLQAQAGQ